MKKSVMLTLMVSHVVLFGTMDAMWNGPHAPGSGNLAARVGYQSATLVGSEGPHPAPLPNAVNFAQPEDNRDWPSPGWNTHTGSVSRWENGAAFARSASYQSYQSPAPASYGIQAEQSEASSAQPVNYPSYSGHPVLNLDEFPETAARPAGYLGNQGAGSQNYRGHPVVDPNGFQETAARPCFVSGATARPPHWTAVALGIMNSPSWLGAPALSLVQEFNRKHGFPGSGGVRRNIPAERVHDAEWEGHIRVKNGMHVVRLRRVQASQPQNAAAPRIASPFDSDFRPAYDESPSVYRRGPQAQNAPAPRIASPFDPDFRPAYDESPSVYRRW